jgi:hypothetical protein
MQLSFEMTPYQLHSRTSKVAAEAMAPKALTKREKLLAYLKLFPDGLTDEQMQVFMPANTQRPRRVELLAAHLIEKADYTRATLSGEQACVWKAI